MSSAGSVGVGHMTTIQRGNLIIGSLNLTADNELKAGACWQYLRENAYGRRIRLALFRLNIDHVLILIFGHLAQELLKLAAALSAYPALQFCQRFIDRLWLGE